MANPNDGQTIAASWNALVNDKPEDNIFEDYWLLNRLKNGEGFMSVDGGDVITASLEYATNGTVAWYSDTQTISTTRSDVFDRAEYSWKEIAGTVVQSELEDHPGSAEVRPRARADAGDARDVARGGRADALRRPRQ